MECAWDTSINSSQWGSDPSNLQPLDMSFPSLSDFNVVLHGSLEAGVEEAVVFPSMLSEKAHAAVFQLFYFHCSWLNSI